MSSNPESLSEEEDDQKPAAIKIDQQQGLASEDGGIEDFLRYFQSEIIHIRGILEESGNWSFARALRFDLMQARNRRQGWRWSDEEFNTLENLH